MYILTGASFDSTKYDVMHGKKVIIQNLKATKDQIIDDLNGIMSPLQRKMMRTLLKHLNELNAHIKKLDDDIDVFMNSEEKQASVAIQNVTGLTNTSAQVINSIWPFIYQISHKH